MNKKINNFSDYVYNNCNNIKHIENTDFKDLFVELHDWFVNNHKDKLEKDIKYPNIRKWIRYKSIGKDADIILKTSGNNLDIVSKLNWYGENIKPSQRYLDCIFSLKTHLNMFMRLYEPRGVNHLWLLENIDSVFSDDKMNDFCRNNEEDGNKIDIKIVKDCIEGMELLAKYTHTIGNYMPCPDRMYNGIKGFKGHSCFNDRIELIFNELLLREHVDLIDDKTAESWKKWFNKKMIDLSLTKLFTSIDDKGVDSAKLKEELINFPLHIKKAFSINELEQFGKYLNVVNTWINERGEILIQKIND